MQRKKTISIVLLMLFCLPLCVGQSSKYYQGAQWKSLFNGKDLTGWKNVGREKWTVDDGAVLGESLVGGDGFIVTEVYRDAGSGNSEQRPGLQKMMQDAGARPAFKGYSSASSPEKFPYVLCTSLNEEIVHGMPTEKKILKQGDIVSIDTGVQLNGYYGDSAITVGVGQISEEAQRLMDVTRESLELAIERARPGNRLFDICGAVERHVTANGFSIVREFVGHGIGTQMHEEPQIPNYVDRRSENPPLHPPGGCF